MRLVEAQETGPDTEQSRAYRAWYERVTQNEGRDSNGDPVFIGGKLHPAYKGPWRDRMPAFLHVPGSTPQWGGYK